MPETIDYTAIFNIVRTNLQAYITDDNGDPRLSMAQIVPEGVTRMPDYPFLVITLPVFENDDGIGFNPPNVHDYEIVESQLASGVVDEIEDSGPNDGKLLIEYGAQFLNGSDPVFVGDAAVNTSTNEAAIVSGVLDDETIQVETPIFTQAGEGFEVRRVDVDQLRLSGRIFGLRVSAFDARGEGHTPVSTVNSLIGRAHSYFADRAQDDLAEQCVVMNLDGIGEITPQDMPVEEGDGAVLRIYRRDLELRLRKTKKIRQRRDDLVTEVATQLSETT